MSNEQIIRSWKSDETNERDEHGTESTERDLQNPAGGQELTPEELEKIEGGSMVAGSCTVTSC